MGAGGGDFDLRCHRVAVPPQVRGYLDHRVSGLGFEGWAVPGKCETIFRIYPILWKYFQRSIEDGQPKGSKQFSQHTFVFWTSDDPTLACASQPDLMRMCTANLLWGSGTCRFWWPGASQREHWKETTDLLRRARIAFCHPRWQQVIEVARPFRAIEKETYEA